MLSLAVLTTLFTTTLAIGPRASADPCSSTNPSTWTFDLNGHYTHTLPNNRTFLVHVPANFKPTTAHALVLSFHGNGGTSSKQETVTGFSDKGLLIDGAGIIAVYPQATLGIGRNGGAPSFSWEGAPYASPAVDDVSDILPTYASIVTESFLPIDRIHLDRPRHCRSQYVHKHEARLYHRPKQRRRLHESSCLHSFHQ